MEHGADILKTKEDGISVFHMAASNNDIHMLDYFIQLERHETIDITTKEGWTPAHLAGFLNNFDSLNLLLESGANLSARHNGGLKVYEEIIRADNSMLLECVFDPYIVSD